MAHPASQWFSRLIKGREDMPHMDRMKLMDILWRAEDAVGIEFEEAVRRYEIVSAVS
jgi:hypothetical protein